jgi:hypothetical protein
METWPGGIKKVTAEPVTSCVMDMKEKAEFTCLPFAECFLKPEGPNILLVLAHCRIMFLLHGSLTHKQPLLIFLSIPPPQHHFTHYKINTLLNYI